MDDIVATTGEVTLLYELTHTESFFGASGVLGMHSSFFFPRLFRVYLPIPC